MDPEKESLIGTLQELRNSIREGNIENVRNIINGFHQNLARNNQLLSELHKSGIQCTTQTDLILTVCQNKKVDILYYILKEADILIHLPDGSFDDTEVNKQRTEAVKHALSFEDFNIIEMLYDFWCGNLHWSGHDIKNIEMVGNVLQNASDAYSNYDDQLQANVHCLLTFNAFQREIYTMLAGLKSDDFSPKSLVDIIPLEMETPLDKLLRIYDEYSNINKIRRKHTNLERDQAIKANIKDDSSMYYRNLEYIYYEVYFRKLDFNVSLLILDDMFVLRDHLKKRFNKKKKYFKGNPDMHMLYTNAANTYDGIESAIYHFIYSTSEHWRLYLPEKRQILTEEHTVIHEGEEKIMKFTIDLHKVYNGPVICFERKSFKESLAQLKIILKEHVIRDDPISNDENDKSEVEKLINENYLQTVSYMRDHYSLVKIVDYIKAIENTTDNNVVMIERVIHVVGEMLKSTRTDTHHLSQSTEALLKTAISVETISHLQKIRDFLSHARDKKSGSISLSTRIDMANTQAQRFKDIKQELIMIKDIMNPILDIFKSILDKSLLKKGLRLLEQRIEDLPDEAKSRVDDIYRRYKIDNNEVVRKSGKYYQGVWRDTGLTLQLLQEIPWIMKNKDTILTDIQSAVTDLNDKLARVLPSLTPYVRRILGLLADNNNYVKTINQYHKSVQMSDCPDAEEINQIRSKLNNLKAKEHIIDLEPINNIKNYKEHWVSVKGMLSFFLKESEMFATIEYDPTNTLTFRKAYDILADMEAICVMHGSTLAWLTGRRAVVLGLKIYRKYEDWMGFRFNQKHFEAIETLHNDQIASKIKPNDPRLAHEKLLLCLINRLDLLKQTLLYEQKIPPSQLVRRFDHDMKFRMTIEMVLADIDNVLTECNIRRLMNKSSTLLRDINLGNVLDHGNPILEVIGDIFNSHDLAAEWLKKAIMFAEDAESIVVLYELFKGKMDYRMILADDLPTTDSRLKQLHAQLKSSKKLEIYGLLTRSNIPKSLRSKK